MGSEADKKQEIVENALAKGNGILRLEPAWVARDFLPPGRRLGLKDDEYELGERGWISERWLGSTTKADNMVGPPDEGLSYIALEGDERMTLKEAVGVAGPAIMGEEYAKAHAEFFGAIRPATTLVEVSRLIDPRMLIEIEATAIVEV